MDQLQKTIRIPESDLERFIDFSAFHDGKEWFGRGVKLAGISHVSAAYLIRYPDPRRFLAMVCGKGRFEVECDGLKREVGVDDLVVMPPGKLHYLRALEPSEMIFLLVCDDGRWPRRAVASHVSATRFFALMELAWSESRHYGGAGDNGPNPGDEEVCRTAANLILALISREIVAPPPGGEEGSRLRLLSGLWREIDRRPGAEWSVEAMAKFCAVSVPHLFALSRRYFKTSPASMLLSIRMRHAESLLSHTRLAIAEVAECCGYHDAYSFARAFRRQVGVLPREYRDDR